MWNIIFEQRTWFISTGRGGAWLNYSTSHELREGNKTELNQNVPNNKTTICDKTKDLPLKYTPSLKELLMSSISILSENQWKNNEMKPCKNLEKAKKTMISEKIKGGGRF